MATAQVFSFFRQPAPRDWAAQDIAEFYRVESVLIQAGLRVVSARGLTDEGEPWFVFCRAEDDEVIVHFARIDGSYVVSAPSYCGNAVGRDFRSLVRGLIENHPMLQLRPRGDNLYLHPSALLVVLVATALFKLSPAAAAAPAAQDGADTAAERLRSGGSAVLPAASLAPLSETEQGTLILAAINGALTLAVVSAPVTGAGFVAGHALEYTGPLHATIADTAPGDMFHSTAPIGTGSLTPMVLQHESAAVVVPADLASHTLISAALPADGATVAGPAGSSPPPPPVVTIGYDTSITNVSLSDLPSIPAADKALLQTLGLTGNVTYLGDLPSVLANALKTGSHAQVHAAAAETSHDATPTQPAATDSSHDATQSQTQSQSVATDTPPVAADAATTPAVSVTATSPASGSETAQHSASTTATAPAVPDMAAVIAAVKEFQSVEVHPVVLLTAHSAIFYDANAVTTQPNAIQSVTYDFGDGFSISLVGLPSELAHAVVHV